ncbi:glycosyltransferase 87 family protein [Kitasatospora viridis]|uniref:Alpha-1,2-mannosyltransferase n=1 Tax=Kitasatospora viridis TaxID=281105 RepID=A0A561UK92_9ACTN|nr:glycosyltransferase 87 family protein [Kitasatospora viridis]TWF99779.1 alpha-1,2-mannosyltransferase [Kitasatospora viridis]
MTVVHEDQRAAPAAHRPGPPAAREWRHRVTEPIRAVREAPRGSVLAAGAFAVVSLFAYAFVRHLLHFPMVDMIVYRAEGSAVVNGTDLYALRVADWNLPATYPPFAAMLFVSTTWFPVGLLRVLVTLGNTGLLALAGLLSFRLAGWPRKRLRPAGVLLVAGAGVWLEPVFTTLRYGQINLLLLCLVLWDLNLGRDSRWKGVGIGIAAGMKLTPGLFAVYLLLTGRVRAAFTAGLTFLGTFGIGLLVLPHATWGFFTKYLYDSSRVGRTQIVDNQSLRGAVARFLHQANPGAPATLLAAVVAVAGLATAVYVWRNERWLPRAEAWGVCCTAVTALLLSPISWTHHWVWCVPLLVLLAAEADTERTRPARLRHKRWRAVFAVTLLGFYSFAMWLVPHKGMPDYRFNLLQQLPAGIYPGIGVCFLALAALRVRARRRAAGQSAAVRIFPQRTAEPTPRELVAQEQRTPAVR